MSANPLAGPNVGSTAESTQRMFGAGKLPPESERLRVWVQNEFRKVMYKSSVSAPNTLDGIADGDIYKKLANVNALGRPSYQALRSGWFEEPNEFVRLSSTQFTVRGDVTDVYTQGRKLRFNVEFTASWAIVDSGSYAAGTDLTTVTIDSAYSVPNPLYIIEHGNEPLEQTAVEVGMIAASAVSFSNLITPAVCGLEGTGSDEIRIKADSMLELGSGGVNVKLATNAGLESSTGLRAKVTGILSRGASGLDVTTNGVTDGYVATNRSLVLSTLVDVSKNVDFSAATGWVNKHSANLARSGADATVVSAIITNLTNSGNVVGTAKLNGDSGLLVSRVPDVIVDASSVGRIATTATLQARTSASVATILGNVTDAGHIAGTAKLNGDSGLLASRVPDVIVDVSSAGRIATTATLQARTSASVATILGNITDAANIAGTAKLNGDSGLLVSRVPDVIVDVSSAGRIATTATLQARTGASVATILGNITDAANIAGTAKLNGDSGLLVSRVPDVIVDVSSVGRIATTATLQARTGASIATILGNVTDAGLLSDSDKVAADGSTYGRIRTTALSSGSVDFGASGVINTQRLPGLLPNGDFERVVSGTTPAKWTGTGTTDTSTSGSGAQSLKLTNGQTDTSDDFIPINPAGPPWVMMADVKTSAAATVRIGVQCFDSAQVSLGFVYCVLNNESVNFSAFRTCYMMMQGTGSGRTYFLAGTKYIKAYADNNTGSAVNVWIDNVRFMLAGQELLERHGNAMDGDLAVSSGTTTLTRVSYQYRDVSLTGGTLAVQPGTKIRAWTTTAFNNTVQGA